CTGSGPRELIAPAPIPPAASQPRSIRTTTAPNTATRPAPRAAGSETDRVRRDSHQPLRAPTRIPIPTTTGRSAATLPGSGNAPRIGPRGNGPDSIPTGVNIVSPPTVNPGPSR